MPQLVAARVLVGLTSAEIISSSSATVTGENYTKLEVPTILILESAHPIR